MFPLTSIILTRGKKKSMSEERQLWRSRPKKYHHWQVSREHGRVLPVRVDQEASEGAVGLGAGVDSIVLRQSHLDPHLVTRDEVEQRAARQRRWFGPVAVELEVGADRVAILHQVELEAGAVDGGVHGKVIHTRHAAGEATRLGVVVALLVQRDLVKVEHLARGRGQREALGQLGTERRLGGHGALSRLPTFALLARVAAVTHQTPQPRLTWWRSEEAR